MRSDEELMAAHVAGESGAFEELFGRYAPLLLRVMTRQVASAEDARDLVQQTFLQVHRARLDFDASAKFRPWVFTIGFNLCRQLGRSRSRRRESPSGDAAQSERAAPLRDLDATHDVRAALAQIPADYREAIVLHWYEGLSFEEASVVVGASVTALKLRAHRGYKMLRALLDDRNPRKGSGVSEEET
jgi:RNA polymerase sigma factor (sigma-70 family)